MKRYICDNEECKVTFQLKTEDGYSLDDDYIGRNCSYCEEGVYREYVSGDIKKLGDIKVWNIFGECIFAATLGKEDGEWNIENADEAAEMVKQIVRELNKQED